jgi:hypothetical protein
MTPTVNQVIWARRMVQTIADMHALLNSQFINLNERLEKLTHFEDGTGALTQDAVEWIDDLRETRAVYRELSKMGERVEAILNGRDPSEIGGPIAPP